MENFSDPPGLSKLLRGGGPIAVTSRCNFSSPLLCQSLISPAARSPILLLLPLSNTPVLLHTENRLSSQFLRASPSSLTVHTLQPRFTTQQQWSHAFSTLLPPSRALPLLTVASRVRNRSVQLHPSSSISVEELLILRKLC